MPHFFVPSKNIKNGRFVLKGEEALHILRVMRLKPGGNMQLFDGEGKIYSAEIESAAKDGLSGRILSENQSCQVKTKINLFQAVPKGERMDWLVEKVAELGIGKITPIITERSVIREIAAQKIERWKRLSQAASKQCGRADLMIIEKPLIFAEAIEGIPKDAASIIPWEAEGARAVNDIAVQLRGSNSINIFIGPEGGFTFGEIESAKNAGILPVTLGSRILRVETAGIVSAVLVLNVSGEFDREIK
ncbi:MAG: RsmE family RNA methyltransferase [Elusimicrobiota bacterium]